MIETGQTGECAGDEEGQAVQGVNVRLDYQSGACALKAAMAAAE